MGLPPSGEGEFLGKGAHASYAFGGGGVPRSVTRGWPRGGSTEALGSSCKKDSLGAFCVFQYGRTPLHLAANNGILDVVRYLCLAGANVEALTSVSHLLAAESQRK